MSKKILLGIAIIVVVLMGFLVYYFFFNDSNNYDSNYTAEKTSISENEISDTNSSNVTNENQLNLTPPTENISSEPPISDTSPTPAPAPVEETIASYSTKIMNTDSARQNNIQITCNTLNETTVENGATFSFCNTVGKATSSNGYQEADIIDNNGNKKKGIGGGNCQISSTLYNAVLEIPSLTVVERHPHSSSVPYVAKGKDAAVAYGSYDFKFTNQTGSTIKLQASTDSQYVYCSIIKIS